jgi:hypothetical protein
MRRTLALMLVVGLSATIAKADDKPAPSASMVAPEKDWRLAQQTRTRPQKSGVLSYYPNNGGGYTFLEREQFAFYSLPYMPSTYWVRVDEFNRGQVRHTTTVLGTIGTSTMPYRGLTFYRSQMKEIPGVKMTRREDTPIAKWTRDSADGKFRLSIMVEDNETRLKLKSIVPVLERAEHAQ